MDIYSQELVTEQENYLFLLKNDASNESILQSVETRLLLLGFSQTQVNALKVSRIVSQSVTIFSPYTGHLHDIVKSEINSGMKESNLASDTELSIREGMYLKKGQTIFNIYDISDLWVDLNVYSDDLELIKVGQTVALYTNEGDTLKVAAKIDFIQPILSEQLQTTIARVYLNNMNKELIVGTLLKAKINSGMKEGIFVPNSSVLNLGNNNVVFLKVDGAFKSTLVNIGIKTAEEIEIISGISESDEIALNAQMLIDSESFVKISR
jgi:Cu(I)/Ag(I) efflux system membrane fusion protein